MKARKQKNALLREALRSEVRFQQWNEGHHERWILAASLDLSTLCVPTSVEVEAYGTPADGKSDPEEIVRPPRILAHDLHRPDCEGRKDCFCASIIGDCRRCGARSVGVGDPCWDLGLQPESVVDTTPARG
jgi:hypothetical protein